MRRYKRYQFITIYALLPFCCAWLVVGLCYRYEKQQELALLINNNSLAIKSQQIRAGLAKQASFKAILAAEARQQKVMNILIYLGSIVPPGLRLVAFTERQQSIEWQGKSGSIAAIIKFKQTLLATELFQHIEITQIMTGGNENEHDFIFQAKLKPLAEAI